MAMTATQGVTDTLAGFAASLRFDDLPEKVIHESKRILLDSIGCALLAGQVDKGRFSIKLAKRLGGPSESTIIGERGKVGCSSAAFANGELINGLDFDSSSAVEHTTPYLLPASLALAESQKASGKDLILSIAIGHEISARVGKCLSSLRELVEEPGGLKHIMPAVHGYGFSTMGAAAAAARMLQLDRNRICQAVGIAGHLTPVPAMIKWVKSGPGVMTKYCSAGWVSQAAVNAALLAEMGYGGDTTVLDGKYGFWKFFGSDEAKWKPEEVVADLGKTWQFADTTNYKVYPCCGLMQIGLELFSKIIEENGITPEDIEHLKLYVDPLYEDGRVWQNRDIKTHIDAQFSVAYVFAVMANGVKLADWQKSDTFRNPDILRFMDKISISSHPAFAKALEETSGDKIHSVGAGIPTIVEVTARGKVFKKEGVFAKGRFTPESCRLTDAELTDKFRNNAVTRLTSQKIEKLAGSILELEHVEDVSQLMQLTTSSKSNAG